MKAQILTAQGYFWRFLGTLNIYKLNTISGSLTTGLSLKDMDYNHKDPPVHTFRLHESLWANQCISDISTLVVFFFFFSFGYLPSAFNFSLVMPCLLQCSCSACQQHSSADALSTRCFITATNRSFQPHLLTLPILFTNSCQCPQGGVASKVPFLSSYHLIHIHTYIYTYTYIYSSRSVISMSAMKPIVNFAHIL